jgi:fumarylacetoacetate (FAA) hydrolase
MKLATLKDGSRDGQLVVVSRDLSQAHFATGIATRMQQLLDDWNFISSPLEDLYATLNGGKARHAFAFDPRHCMAPLPRACQLADAAAFPPQAALQRRLRSEADPAEQPALPQLTHGASDHFLGATDDAVFIDQDPADDGPAIDFEAGLAVVTGDVAMGASPETALEGVRLLMLSVGWRLRQWPAGWNEVQGRPATAFGPVAVTPDELGESWVGGRAHLTVESRVNDRRIGHGSTGAEMRFHFGQLIAHLACTRRVGAGSIVVGSGVAGSADPAQGAASIAELPAAETLAAGTPRSHWLQFGDTLGVEMTGADGHSVFGATLQRVVASGG